MDRAEISKRIERAEKLLQKGKTGDALEEYLQVLAVDPSNDTICQMAADLCLSLQRIPEAVALLGAMFDRQTQAGDATRASLTYKKLARFANPSWEQKLHFGQLLENTNRKLALETYENALQETTKQGRKQDSLKVLQCMLRLDSGEKNLLRQAELSSELGDGKAAAASFLKVAELAQSSGGNGAQWIERAYAEDPGDGQIALAYSKGLIEQGQVGAAIFVLESQVNAGSPSEELRETYGKALLVANRLTDAEPVIWQLFEENPSRNLDVAKLIGQYIDAGQDTEAVALARKLEQHQRRKGDRRAFLVMMQELTDARRPSAQMLEFMSELFNASNRETDYCQTLLKLFDLHYGLGNYDKAADSLDRAAEIDPYEHGHKKRLELLRGKIDDNRYRVIVSRFSGLSDARTQPARQDDDKLLGAAALQDLILQAEILVQYGMRSKAIERLQRIQQLFPHEEERNQALQQLYLTAGVVPNYGNSEPAATAPRASAPPPAPPAPVPASVPAASTAAPTAQSDANVSSFARVSEITRKLYRQSNADAVTTTAVKEIGEQWNLSRCVIAMRKPGLAATSTKEYCGNGSRPGDTGALARVVSTVHDLAINHGGALNVSNIQAADELLGIRDAFGQLDVNALLALPLTDGAEQVGVLLLMHNSVLTWNANDVEVLKTICDQIVIALNNAGLRRLVKNLSVTDERSGLLKRASYLDLLMAETRRNVQQTTPLSVLLVQFGEKAATLKEMGEAALETTMQQIGQLFAANIRQNDLAFRYELTTIAIVLGETSEKEGLQAAEKLQRLVGQLKRPDKAEPVRFSAGLAEAVVRAEYDPADIVTEVANRAERALQTAIGQGMGKTVALAAAVTSAAVA